MKIIKIVNLNIIFICSYVVKYILTEYQAIYSLIIAWVFIILATEGIRFLIRKSIREENFEEI